MLICGLPKPEYTPELLAFLLMKYTDIYSYEKLFLYLFENFKFKPK